MKTPVPKADADSVRSQFPIDDRLSGWFFRVAEQSSGVYCVEGRDLWGRTVSDVGTDVPSLLDSCVSSARCIDSRVSR